MQNLIPGNRYILTYPRVLEYHQQRPVPLNGNENYNFQLRCISLNRLYTKVLIGDSYNFTKMAFASSPKTTCHIMSEAESLTFMMGLS